MVDSGLPSLTGSKQDIKKKKINLKQLEEERYTTRFEPIEGFF